MIAILVHTIVCTATIVEHDLLVGFKKFFFGFFLVYHTHQNDNR